MATVLRECVPATVTDPPDLAIDTRNKMTAPLPLNIDRDPAKVSRHAVVLDHCYKGNDCEDVMENPIASRFDNTGPKYDHHRRTHGGHDGPIPV